MPKILKPSNTNQAFSFVPRFTPQWDLTLFLKNEATEEEIELQTVYSILKNNLISITFDLEVQERDRYEVRIMHNGDVCYRGKILCTDQADTQEFKITEGYIQL